MSEIFNLSRRDFLRSGLLAGGGLVLGLHLPSLAKGDEPRKNGEPFELNAFVRIATDDSVTVIVNHTEMGQGPYTSVPMLVAEELDADWAKVRFEAAPVAAVYNHSVYGIQITGSSSST
jgi:isoquinoline 1-oxidoreductase subunit beta